MLSFSMSYRSIFFQSQDEKERICNRIALIMEENGFVNFNNVVGFHKSLDRYYFCNDTKLDKLSRINSQQKPYIGFAFFINNGIISAFLQGIGTYSIEFVFDSITESVEDEIKRMLSYTPLFMNLIYLCKLKSESDSFPIPHIFTFTSTVKVGFTGEDYNYGCKIKLDKHSPENTTISFTDPLNSRISKEYNLYDLSELVSDFNTNIFWEYHYFF